MPTSSAPEERLRAIPSSPPETQSPRSSEPATEPHHSHVFISPIDDLLKSTPPAPTPRYISLPTADSTGQKMPKATSDGRHWVAGLCSARTCDYNCREPARRQVGKLHRRGFLSCNRASELRMKELQPYHTKPKARLDFESLREICCSRHRRNLKTLRMLSSMRSTEQGWMLTIHNHTTPLQSQPHQALSLGV